MDGRDVAPGSGNRICSKDLESYMAEIGVGTNCYYIRKILCNG